MGLIEIVLAGLCLNATCESEDSTVSATIEKNIYKRENRLLTLGQELSNDALRITTFKNGRLSGYLEENGTISGTGVAFQIVKILQDKFKFNYTVVLPKSDIFLETGNKDGAKDLLENKKADLAAAFLPIVNAFRGNITYSTSLDTAEWVVLMNRPKESASGSGLLAPFTTPVWILIIFSILVVGPIIYLLILIQARLCKQEKNPVYPLPTCVWFVYGALLKQGSTLSPKTDSSRLLFSTWWIFILILTAFYTANLTAFLTLSTFTLPINSAADIGSKHYKWVTNSANGIREIIYAEAQEFLIQTRLVDQIGDNQNFPEMNDMEILREYVTDQKMMFIREKSIINHIMYSDYKIKVQDGIDEAKRCTYVVTKFPVTVQNRAFAYGKHFKYKDLFDNEIQHLVESGIIQYKLREDLPDAEICPLNLKSTERKLRNSDLLLTYILVGSGLAIATCVFLLEVLWRLGLNKCAQNKQPRIANTEIIDDKFSMKNNFDVNITNVSPPPTYQSLFNPAIGFGYTEGVKKNINGRDYWIVNKSDGLKQLIPLRTPSALLFRYAD